MRVTENTKLPRGASGRGVDCTIPTRREADPRKRPAAAPNPMSVELSRPGHGVVVLSVGGEIDCCTQPRLRELLWHRLTSCAQVVVLDLSGVTFCNSDGLRLLDECQRRAEQREISFRVVPDERGLLVRLLDVLDSRERFALRPDLAAAVRP